MKISGSATVGHPVPVVFAALTDPAVLVRTLPGCRRLEQTGPDSYSATLEAGVGSITGLFDGDVRLSDLAAPTSFTLHASGAGKPGTVDAVARVRLLADPSGGTLVEYEADATVGGVIGGVGQRMIAGAARRTAGRFFAAVDRELSLTASPAAAVAAPAATADLDQAAPVEPALAADAPRVWTRPVPQAGGERQRLRELILAAGFGAAIALLGVLLGAVVARW